MITDLETILNTEEFQKLINAINNNEAYNFNDNGLTIKAESTNDSLMISLSYSKQDEESEIIKKEVNEFQKYLDELDDNLFVETCEALGDVKSIQDCLTSNNLETVRSAIYKFKATLSKVVKEKINLLNKYV